MHALLLAACCLISGNVHSGSGLPVSGARVSLHGAAARATASDASGSFSVSAPPGDYQMDVTARGYGSVTIDLKVDHDSKVEVELQPLDAPTLRTIGTVSVDGRLAPVRGTIPSVTVTRQDMERLGNDRVVQSLTAIPSVTFAYPHGGQPGGIATVALRGPDPSETLVTLDGQVLNDANTGDVDLSQFPVAAFSSMNVTEGLGPRDSGGSNTIGGEINLVSLAPTREKHVGFGEEVGSFGLSNLWLNATGTNGRLGYAVAGTNLQQLGYVHNQYQSVNVGGTQQIVPLGSSISARSALLDATWSFSQNADLTARVFTMGNNRDQSSAINGQDTLGNWIGAGNQSLLQNIRAYQLRGRAPLGSGTLTGELSANDNDVTIDGSASDPMYDVTHQDKRSNLALSWERTFDTGDFGFGGYTRHETFSFIDPAGNAPNLSQNITSAFVRGSVQASKELQLSGALYSSHYTTFGTSTDWRLGAIYNTSPSTAIRFSAGTGFRAPLLIELYQFPLDQLTLDAQSVFLGQGNPSEQPEHATEYELGFSQRFSQDATLDASLYRTNLRNAIENFYPLALAQSGGCAANSVANPVPGCVSYPVNVGNVVYEGAELRFAQRFPREHLFLNAMYGLNIAYPYHFGTTISNPTSGGNLVNNQQFLGIPQQQGSLQLDWADKSGWHVSALAAFRGNNNELNIGPFTWIDASVGVKINPLTDISIVGTNIFSAGSGRYPVYGGGVPYNGIVGPTPTDYGPIPTDRLVTNPASLKLVITVHT
ncbi:MAG TPA: TonB-dependent receptor [Candidatus Aquilonibacter sp.]|nr:TonB-dependent receptor [Candidatus Aquilonibacter sp.]